MVAVRQDRAPPWVTPPPAIHPPLLRLGGEGWGRGGLTRPLPARLTSNPPRLTSSEVLTNDAFPFPISNRTCALTPSGRTTWPALSSLHDAFLYVQFDAY